MRQRYIYSYGAQHTEEICVRMCLWMVRRDGYGYSGVAVAIAIDTSICFARTSQLPVEIKCRCTRIETVWWDVRAASIPRAPTQKLPLVIIKDVKWIGIHIRNCSFPFPFLLRASFFQLLLVDAIARIGSSPFLSILPPRRFHRKFLPIHLNILIDTSFE